MLDRRAHPFVETVVDDVHATADAPLRAGDATRDVEHVAIRFVELNAEVVEHRPPEPVEVRRRSLHQMRVVAQAMRAHEGGQPAALDVLGRWPPRNISTELESVHDMSCITWHNPRMPDYEPAVIVSACRTPIGSFGGVFKDLSAADLGAVVIREAIRRAAIEARDLGDVVMGCVLQAGAGMNVARQAAIKAGVPVEVPGETVNRVCGSGLQAVVHAVEAIRVGYVDTMVAGGTESMSNAPYLLKGARWGYRMGNAEAVDSMLLEGLTCAMGGCHMGITAEEIAARYKVSRADQDAFAAQSQERAVRAIADGRFKEEIVGVPVPQKNGAPVVVDTDEYPRAGTTAEKLAALKPAFRKDGTVTAGNASGINDGAAALVVSTGRKARDLGRKPLARILSYV